MTTQPTVEIVTPAKRRRSRPAIGVSMAKPCVEPPPRIAASPCYCFCSPVRRGRADAHTVLPNAGYVAQNTVPKSPQNPWSLPHVFPQF